MLRAGTTCSKYTLSAAKKLAKTQNGGDIFLTIEVDDQAVAYGTRIAQCTAAKKRCVRYRLDPDRAIIKP